MQRYFESITPVEYVNNLGTEEVDIALDGILEATKTVEPTTARDALDPFGTQIMEKAEPLDPPTLSGGTPNSPEPTWTIRRNGVRDPDDGGTGPGDETAPRGLI